MRHYAQIINHYSFVIIKSVYNLKYYNIHTTSLVMYFIVRSPLCRAARQKCKYVAVVTLISGPGLAGRQAHVKHHGRVAGDVVDVAG